LLGGRAAPVARATEPCPQCHGSPQVQMRVVFPGEADTTEYLDTVLGVVHCGIECIRCRWGGGECVLLWLPIGTRGVPGERRGEFRPAEHFRAHVFDRLELADRSAELFADFRVLACDADTLVGDAGCFRACQGEREVTHTFP